STTTVTATGTFAQDPTRASNPGAVVVSGTVTITSTGALCTPAAATQQYKSHAASLLQGRKQTVHIATADCSAPGTSGAGAPITFANVRGRLKIKTDGTSSWASLSFIVKPGTPTTGKHHENEGIPVILTGLRTTP
ncbi:MAG: hypothetical protein JWO42_4055, partial [Chloroflexi bacterium]|nr:hypothetical protein [Chloroflexota bacterium]